MEAVCKDGKQHKPTCPKSLGARRLVLTFLIIYQLEKCHRKDKEIRTVCTINLLLAVVDFFVVSPTKCAFSNSCAFNHLSLGPLRFMFRFLLVWFHHVLFLFLFLESYLL